MARNGSGTYSLPAGNPVTTGTTISSTWANNTLNDIGSAMTASLAYDGQTVPVANLPMGSYIHTGVGNATARTNYASAAQVQDSTLTYLTSISGTDTITALAPVSMSALAAGQTFRFIAAGANTTTAVTLNINSIGAKNITKNGTTALAIGDIPSGSIVVVVYDGTQFQLTTLPTYTAPFNLTTNNTWTGKQTFTGSSNLISSKFVNALENITVSATAATGTINYDVTTQSVVYYTSNASANWTVNFRASSGTSLDTAMATGEVITVVFLVTQGTTAYYNNVIQVDGTTITPKWQGGSAPTAGNVSGIDTYTYAIIKTGSAAFTILASVVQFK
jgi:hypothetical protein